LQNVPHNWKTWKEKMPTSQTNNEAQDLILVTGASGYIASQLIPHLLEKGLKVRCLVRNSAHLKTRKWVAEVEVVSGDLTQPESLEPALQGVSSAYYLVHSMSSGRDYIEQDLKAARDFSTKAKQAGVEHIIYLGGLADPQDEIASHMRSRIDSGQALRTGGVPVTEFRASVIIGPGSISFEMIRYLTEQFPIIICPRWMPNLAQPIAIQNILDYLLAALDLPEPVNQVFEIGGSEVMPYTETMLRYARQRGLQRRILILSFNPVRILAFFMSWFTPVPRAITRPLVEGLCSHSIVRNNSALQAFPKIQPMGYDRAVQLSLSRLRPDQVEPIWRQTDKRVRSSKHAGFCILQRQVITKADAWVVLEAIQNRINNNRKYELVNAEEWLSESRCEKIMLMRSNQKLPGQLWQEWRVTSDEGHTSIAQTILFAPKGLTGFLGWYGVVNCLRLAQWFSLHRLARQRS
jgi:uncharacterized protein YbjT (DUF2867 family)